MAETKVKVVVAGDVSVDWYSLPRPAEDKGLNWQLYPSLEHHTMGGGALQLCDFLRRALAAAELSAQVNCCQLSGDLRRLHPEEVLHSNARLDYFEEKSSGSESRATTIRVKEPMGYCGPRSGQRQPCSSELATAPADVVVLDDAGNGFRDCESAWPGALASDSPYLLIHKMRRPLCKSLLWDRLQASPQARRVVILHAHDLRQIEGVNISRSLSWERTAKELVYHLQWSRELQWLRDCSYSHLVVLFDSDGALVVRGGEGGRATLVFDPRRLEGGFADSIKGGMIGLGASFAGAFTAKLLQLGEKEVLAAVQAGLDSSRSLLKAGYHLEEGGLAYPKELFSNPGSATKWGVCEVPPAQDLNDPDPTFWRMLDTKTRNTRLQLARDMVVKKNPQGLDEVPVGVFGKLKTLDRSEIESFGAIRELMVEYLANPKPEQPLAFAVFGPPGAGKSFGVKQVLATIQDSRLDKPLVFNLSQLQDYRDLVAAFHRMRDQVLAGIVPVAFFDEFDANLGQQPLGWLKYFLAPIQDGEFRDGAEEYHLGKCIMVFAGGTRCCFRDFESNQGPNSGLQESTQPDQGFVAAKGPDFVSRLRGFIDVLGPNPQGSEDQAFVLRRANLLRTFLNSKPQVKGLSTSTGELRIDPGILRAMLYVSRYKHGARSLQAVIEMSRLAGKSRFDLSCLPPMAQLDMHVDAREFMWLSERERFHGMLGEIATEPSGSDAVERERDLLNRIVPLIHREYLRCTGEWKSNVDDAKAFQGLAEDMKKSNLDAAQEIPNKLLSVGFCIRRKEAGSPGHTPELTDEEVEKLAVMEHDRWCRERRLQGWSHGPKKDKQAKKSPSLLPYANLSEEEKRLNRMSVIALVIILNELGFEVFRMQEVPVEIPPQVVEPLASEIHEAYRKERLSAGEAPKSNPSLVGFGDLPADLQEANRDQVRSLARHLRAIGYQLRLVEPGQKPIRLQLNDEEIEKLAQAEHSRWMWQKVIQGWTYLPGKKSIAGKTSPCLVPWKHLTSKEADKDRQAMRNIPAILAKAGLEAYRA